MKRIINHFILFYPLCFIALSFSACGQGTPSGGGETTSLPVMLSFRVPEARKVSSMSKVAVSNVATVEIFVTGDDMPKLIAPPFNIGPGEAVLHTLDIEIGPARVFAITIFDSKKNAIYGGQSPPTEIRRVAPGQFNQLTVLLHPLLVNLPSELPKLSENYLMLDVLGVSPFTEAAKSRDYIATTGIPALKGKTLTSTNYTLR